jgi:hypothetical protein
MGRSLRFLVFCGVFLGSLIGTTRGGLQPLLGGQLTWEVNPNFMTGTRQVTFTLKTATEKSNFCTYKLDDTVSCALAEGRYPDCEALKNLLVSTACPGMPTGTTCSVFAEAARQRCYTAEEHGVLCVRQLLKKTDGNYQTRFWDDESQCVHDVNLWNSTAGGTSPGKATYAEANKVGATNVFRTLSLHDKVENTVWERMAAKTQVVVGVMTHTITVEPNAVALVAFFAPRYGFSHFSDERGLLLPTCGSTWSASNSLACSVNMEALGRSNEQTTEVWRSWTASGAPTGDRRRIRISDTGTQSVLDRFWAGFGSFQGVNGDRESCNNIRGCLRSASPSLETFVPLCRDTTDATDNCNIAPINNYFSPQTFLPVLTEVAVTAATVATSTEAASGDFFSYNLANRMAPHPPMLMQSVDYDGHKMGVYIPGQGCQSSSQCFPSNEPDSVGMPVPATERKYIEAQCFFGRLDGKFENGRWLFKRCRTGANRGRSCLTDANCGLNCAGCCAVPPTGCRDNFDYDRCVPFLFLVWVKRHVHHR